MRTVTDVSFPKPVCSLFLALNNLIICVTWQALKNYRYDDDTVLSACGVSIEKQLMQVDGRVLETPKVNAYGTLFFIFGGTFASIKISELEGLGG